jgi:hypothetical protein
MNGVGPHHMPWWFNSNNNYLMQQHPMYIHSPYGYKHQNVLIAVMVAIVAILAVPEIDMKYWLNVRGTTYAKLNERELDVRSRGCVDIMSVVVHRGINVGGIVLYCGLNGPS